MQTQVYLSTLRQLKFYSLGLPVLLGKLRYNLETIIGSNVSMGVLQSPTLSSFSASVIVANWAPTVWPLQAKGQQGSWGPIH